VKFEPSLERVFNTSHSERHTPEAGARSMTDELRNRSVAKPFALKGSDSLLCFEIPGSSYICNSGIAWTAARAQLVHRI
jgi:hypothetical protein